MALPVRHSVCVLSAFELCERSEVGIAKYLKRVQPEVLTETHKMGAGWDVNIIKISELSFCLSDKALCLKKY